jgi:hypothetical protein
MSMQNAMVSGLVGAGVLTAIHEGARQVIQDAPRMEILAKRAVAYSLEAADAEVPPNRYLHPMTLVGDIAANTAYYSLIGLARPENGLAVGAALGLAAGIGGVLLPGPMGLGTEPSARTPQTAAMTIAWYTLGGLAAGLVYSLMSNGNSAGEAE